MKIDLSVSKYWEHVDINKLEEHYKAKFVCESAIKIGNRWNDNSSLIFYSTEKHPRGSNYMAFSYNYATDEYVVSDGISVTEIDIYGVVTDHDTVIYSRFRHDYRVVDGAMIDGGRDYVRSSVGNRVTMRIIDGELKVIEQFGVDEVKTSKEEDTWFRANGVKGCLIRCIGDQNLKLDRYLFRVYDDEYGFIDYEISHHDIELVIDDHSAAFRKIGGKYYLDYVPEDIGGY